LSYFYSTSVFSSSAASSDFHIFILVLLVFLPALSPASTDRLKESKYYFIFSTSHIHIDPKTSYGYIFISSFTASAARDSDPWRALLDAVNSAS
jgi:hypothetical protein